MQMRNPTYAVTFYRMLILKKRQSPWNTGSWAFAITFAITTQRMNVGRSQNFSLSRYLNFFIAVAKFSHPRVWWTMRSELNEGLPWGLVQGRGKHVLNFQDMKRGLRSWQ